MLNKKLFNEGMRQAFLFGITMLITSTLLNCFTPANELINNQINKGIGLRIINPSYSAVTEEDYDELLEQFSGSPEIVEMIKEQFINNTLLRYIEMEEANTPMLVLMLIIPLVMIFSQFQFINDRSGCDFYHSIPFTRLSIVVNFSLPALIWIILSISIPILCNSFIYSLVDTIVLDYSMLIPEIAEKIIIAFLVYSALLIGVSLSGQLITCFIIASMVLFFPRFLITMGIASIDVNTQYIRKGEQIFTNLIGNNLNLLVRKISSIPDDWSSSFQLSQPVTGAYIYTFILALVLFAIGCYAFTKRPSEATGQNTINPLAQHIIRIGLVTPLVIFATHFYIEQSWSIFSNHMNLILPIAIFIVILYFSYEVITTKDGKKLVQSVLVFPVLILIAVGYYGIISLNSQSILSNSEVDINHIKSVNFDFNQASSYSSESVSVVYDSFTSDLIKDYDIINGQVLELVSTTINTQVEKLKYKDLSYYDDTISIPVTFDLYNSELSRVITFELNTLEEVLKILENDTHINTTILTQLPEKSDLVSAKISVKNSAKSSSLVSNYDYAENIANVLYDEYNTLSNEQQLKVQNTDNLSLVLSLNTQNSSKVICLNELLPKTRQLVIDTYIENNQSNYNVLNYYLDQNKTLDNFYIKSLDNKYNLTTQPFFQSSVEQNDELYNLLKTATLNLNNQNLDYDNMYLITFNITILGSGVIDKVELLLPLTDDVLDIILN